MSRHALAPALLLLAALLAPAPADAQPAGSVLAKVKNDGTMKVCYAQTTPDAFKDSRTGQWSGVFVDLTNELAAWMKVKVEPVEVTFATVNGNTIRRIVTSGTGAPCRHCLQNGTAGETILLGSYNLPGPQGIYWTPSPIFLHERPCTRFDADNQVPDIVRTSLVSVRAYDQNQMCLYDLGQVAPGPEADAPLAHAIADPRTDFVNIHTARPGCLLCRVEPIR